MGGAFINIQLPDGVMLQFVTPSVEFSPQHYAYLLDDDHFDRAYAAIGGEGTLAAANRPMDLGLKTAGVPKAVGNDLDATAYTSSGPRSMATTKPPCARHLVN